jgi:hypothetical protein
MGQLSHYFDNNPSLYICCSRSLSSASFSLLAFLIARVSRPCTVRDSEIHLRPSAVLAEVENAPCIRHTPRPVVFPLPLTAPLRHCCPLRLLFAEHLRLRLFPKTTIVELVSMTFFLFRRGKGFEFMIFHATPCKLPTL